jgi:hypothetical protein
MVSVRGLAAIPAGALPTTILAVTVFARPRITVTVSPELAT